MSRPGRFTPEKEKRYPPQRRLGEPQGRSGRVQKISRPSGFDPRTVQPVASRYTDHAIPGYTSFRYLDTVLSKSISMHTQILFIPESVTVTWQCCKYCNTTLVTWCGRNPFAGGSIHIKEQGGETHPTLSHEGRRVGRRRRGRSAIRWL